MKSKTRLLLGSVLTLSLGCGGAQTPAKASAPTPTAEQATDTRLTAVNALVDAVNTNDADKVSKLYAEQANLHVIGDADLKGRDDVRSYFRKLFAAAQPIHVATTRVFLPDGGPVIVEWVAHAKHTGALDAHAATGKEVGVPGAAIVWFDANGLIQEQHSYLDGKTLLAQIGAIQHPNARPAPPKAEGAPTVVRAGGPEEAKNLEAAVKKMEAFEKPGDAFSQYFEEDVEWDQMSQAGTMRGREPHERIHKMTLGMMPDLKVEVRGWPANDFVILEFTLKGTPGGAKAPPGTKPLQLHVLDVLRMKNHRIARDWAYANSSELPGPPPKH